MPKRMLDDSFLSSPSMAVLSPRAQDAFPRFILLADDFGCFEVNARQLWAKGWPDRTDVTEQDVANWLHEYTTKTAPGEPPPAIMWTERGRRWCYLTGWHGEHGQKHRAEYDREKNPKGSKRRTPQPPPDLVAAVMSGVRRADGLPPGSDVFPPGKDGVPAREAERGNTSDSVPARDAAGKPEIPAGFPGSAVAVPVAVPAAVGADAEDVARRLCVVDEGGPPTQPAWQAAIEFRRLVQDGMALTRLPAGAMSPEEWTELDARVVRCGGAGRAASWCLEKWRNRKKGTAVRGLGWFLAVMRDAPEPQKASREFVGLGPNGEPLYAEAGS